MNRAEDSPSWPQLRTVPVRIWRILGVTFVVCALLLMVSRSVWISWIGRSLMCQEDIGAADLVLIDNSDQNYLAFERATDLIRKGMAPRAAVTVRADVGTTGSSANRVA